MLRILAEDPRQVFTPAVQERTHLDDEQVGPEAGAHGQSADKRRLLADIRDQ